MGNYKLVLLGLLMGISFFLPVYSQVHNTNTSANTNMSDTSITDDAKETLLDNIPIVSLDENDNQDGSAQNISGYLNLGRNPFVSAATFNFGVVRFRARGYDADMSDTYMNGAPMENLDNGFTPYGLWGGLNDVLRRKSSDYGLQSTNMYNFGAFGGSTMIDARASKQYKQTSIGYSNSNRNYVHRMSFTQSTGMNAKGWAFSFSGSRRWADEGFSDGTFYDGWSGYLGIDKQLNAKHLLSLVIFAAPTVNGRQGSSVQEMLDIAGTNYYNPYWGYQNGKKRNASIATTFQPLGILTHEWTISKKSTLLTAVSIMSGDRSTTGLDWYNAADPRPDYYKYLPSYQDDPVLRQKVYDELANNEAKRQIDWDHLYNVNYMHYETINNVNGVQGNNVYGRRALYILEERVTHTDKYNFNTTFVSQLSKHVDLSAGFTYEAQRNNYYKKVNDLLGADFYVDLNQYAERDFPTNPDAGQNDLNHPNRILKEGDKFGYDYDIHVRKTSIWYQLHVKIKDADFFVGAQGSNNSFWRVGNVKSGIFANNSYGKSEEHNFTNYAIKAGFSYKFAEMNYMFANTRIETRAPYFDNSYLAPRTRDFVQDNLGNEKVSSAELGYALIAPTVKFRATGYYTIISNQTNVLTFYDDSKRTFVNYALKNIGKEQEGVEVGTEVIVYKGFNITGAAAIGQNTYNTRQYATVTADNTSEVLEQNQTIYPYNYKVPGTQQAYNIGLNYRSPNFWFVNVNFNYFDEMWLDFNPLRRTVAAVDGTSQGSETWNEILTQTKLKPQFTMDCFAGISWLMNNKFKMLHKRTILALSLGVNNVLNNTNIVSGGFEQLRFDFAAKDVDKFPPKKFYAYGINYSLNLALRF